MTATALELATSNTDWDSQVSFSPSVTELPRSIHSQKAAMEDWLVTPDFESKRARTEISESGARMSTTTLEASLSRRSPATLLAEWNGCVLSVDTSHFSAALKGVFGEGVRGEEEDAEIPVTDVGESDKELLHPGNFFRLCIFYEIQKSGQPRRYTQVVFRRLPAYRTHDLAQAAERASELHRALRVE